MRFARFRGRVNLNVSLLMAHLRSFRILVVSSALFYLAWMLLPYMPRTLPQEVEKVLAWGGYGASPWIQDPRFYLAIGVGKLVATVGLYLLLSWGRWLLLGVVTVGIITLPFAGIATGYTLDNIVGSFLGLTDGAILALAFLSPISEAMRKDE